MAGTFVERHGLWSAAQQEAAREVERRIERQQARVDKGVSAGQITAGQAARDDAKLAREQTSLYKDMATDNGHITRAEQRNLNRRLNAGSARIHHQRVTGGKS